MDAALALAVATAKEADAGHYAGRRIRVDPALYDGETREPRAAARLPIRPAERARRVATILRAGVDTVDVTTFGRCSGIFGSRAPEAKAGCPAEPGVALAFGRLKSAPPAGPKSSCLTTGGRIQRVVELDRSPWGSSRYVFDDQYLYAPAGWRRVCRELVLLGE